MEMEINIMKDNMKTTNHMERAFFTSKMEKFILKNINKMDSNTENKLIITEMVKLKR